MATGFGTTMGDEPARDAASAGEIPYLFVALECVRPAAGGVRIPLAGVRTIDIGRGTERSVDRRGERLVVRVPDERMSRSHVPIERVGDTWVYSDEASRNGTFIDGARATHGLLDAVAVLQAGRTFFAFRAAAPRVPDQPCMVLTLNPQFARTLFELERIASSSVEVFIRGESGTGKELVARAVHDRSGRAGQYVAVNCGAIPATLVESELFGAARGAFSGAADDRAGHVVASSGGTLFLDEIGDLPLDSQASLLRVLQERSVTPLGTTRARPVDLRVVTATHRDVEALVADRAFRDDLYGRLDDYNVDVPPLRARPEDLGTIIAELLRRRDRSDVSLSADSGAALLRYRWPRNVRELDKCLHVALALAEDGVIDASYLAEAVRAAPPTSTPPIARADVALRDQLKQQLREHHGNVSAVARSMGKQRTQVQRWLVRLDLDAADYRVR